jgi:L-ascorbate metabolism protein UlaG (beta-lactamase superfamily)
MTELVVDPARLDMIDIVTSSHNHTDHLDAETLGPILTVNPRAKLLAAEANRAFVADRLKIDPAMPIGLDDGGSTKIFEVHFFGVASAHETVDVDDQGRAKFLGYVLKFGSWTLYHSGDTVRYDGMAEKLEPLKIDVALLPINGRAPERRVAGNLSGREAAQLAKDMQAKLVIPCHYEMFEFNTASPDEFIRECRTLQQPFSVLRCGEAWHSPSDPRI